MSFYRTAGGPFVGLTPAYLQSFGFNLQAPDRGPYVPVPCEIPRGGDWSFEGRPLRSSAPLFVQAASDLVGRLPEPDPDRPLSGFGPSKNGLDWYLTNRKSDRENDRFGFTFHRKEKEGKGRFGRFYEIASHQGRTFVGLNVIARPHFCLTQESQWSREDAANTDLLRTTVFSKEGPPGWNDLPVFSEILPLSLALYETRGDEPLRVQADKHRGWTNLSSAFDGPESVAAWLEPAFRHRESVSVRTLREIGFFDRYGQMPNHQPVLEARCFRPYNKSEWYLDISYRQISGEARVPEAVAQLARTAIEAPATEG